MALQQEAECLQARARLAEAEDALQPQARVLTYADVC
jgi:hypothetical protein